MVILQLSDMVRSNHMSGARLLHIIKKHIKAETEEMNMENILTAILPGILAKNLPLDRYESEKAEIFYLLYDILTSKKFEKEVSQ